MVLVVRGLKDRDSILLRQPEAPPAATEQSGEGGKDARQRPLQGPEVIWPLALVAGGLLVAGLAAALVLARRRGDSAGPSPEAAYVIDSPFGDLGQAFAWRPSATYPAIAGTDWGLVLIAAQGDAELVMKTIDRFEDLVEVRVNGGRAYWFPVQHVLTLETERDSRTYAVRGNVLIWQGDDGVAYRLETSLGRARAIQLAEGAR